MYYPSTTMKIELQTIHCKRCGWNWSPRTSDVRRCPKCKSFYWDLERIKVIKLAKKAVA
jgi:predicted Zn-ribbon and HTH transcriptional regulator